MFEQSMLKKANEGRRFLSTCLGVTGEALVVAGVVIAPMVWPQVLERPKDWVKLYTPTVPRPVGDVSLKKTHVEPTRSAATPHRFTVPTSIPAKPAIPTDPPVEEADIGVVGSVPTGSVGGGGGGGGFSIGDFLNSNRPAPDYRPSTPRPVAKPVEDAPAKTVRIRIGSIDPSKLLVCVKPAYPPLAKAARVSGTVELEGVIGTDGRLKEIRVKSGNALLITAAVDAVRQWVYKPTFLSGDPVEVSTTIVVNFILGQ